MAYTKTNWQDRAVETPNKYTKSGETSTEVTLVQAPGTITQAGTPINAANLNKLEQGVEDAHSLVATAQSEIDTHEALTNPHSATSAATPSRLMLRDANGRVKVAAPSATDDVAIKQTVDDHAALTAPHSATSSATANRIPIRDASGRTQFADPSAAQDAATKAYVDARYVTGTYTGDGTASRDIALPFTPSAVFIAPKFGIASGGYDGLAVTGSPVINGIAFITIGTNKVTVAESGAGHTNVNSQVYHYIAFR